MGEVLELTSLRDCTLWKQLKDGFTETKHKVYSDRLAENLVQICEEASERMKAFPSLHPQYTLHDQTHLLRVTELMAYIIPDEVLHAVLNPIELAMLILAAHFHDQGMVLDSHEIDQLSSEKEFQLFRANWELDHPNPTVVSRDDPLCSRKDTTLLQRRPSCKDAKRSNESESRGQF